MTPNDLALQELAAAKDAAAASWNAAHAAWASTAVSGFAALATVAAVITAFVVQHRQAKDDRALQDSARRQAIQDVAEVFRSCTTTLLRIADDFEHHQMAMNPDALAKGLRRALATVDFYLARDIPNAGVAAAMLMLRPLLAATYDDFCSWVQHTKGQPDRLTPDQVRQRLGLRLAEINAGDQLAQTYCAAVGITAPWEVPAAQL